MGKPKAQKAPSAQEQATAQTAQDKSTAYYNSQLQNMDQFTPYGNLTYQNLGTEQAPKWQSTIALSPEQKQVLDSQNRQDIALNTLGEGQIGRITDAVSTPFSFGGLQNQLPTATDVAGQQTRAEEALLARLNPQFARDEESLRGRLINQGIGQGSEAYRREMESFGQRQNDARTQAVLYGQQYGGTAQQQALQRREQEIGEYTTQRNAPLNELTALTSGTQIQSPQVQVSTGNQGISSFNIAEAMRNQYSNEQAAANNAAGATSSLLGLGGQALGTYFGGPVGGAVGGFLGSSAGSLFSRR